MRVKTNELQSAPKFLIVANFIGFQHELKVLSLAKVMIGSTLPIMTKMCQRKCCYIRVDDKFFCLCSGGGCRYPLPIIIFFWSASNQEFVNINLNPNELLISAHFSLVLIPELVQIERCSILIQ